MYSSSYINRIPQRYLFLELLSCEQCQDTYDLLTGCVVFQLSLHSFIIQQERLCPERKNIS